MKKLTLFTAGVALLLAGCQKETVTNEASLMYKVDLTLQSDMPRTPAAPLTKAEMETEALRQLHAGGIIRWENMSDQQLWSAVVQSDSLIAVGYQPENHSGIENNIHLVDVKQGEWLAVKEALINYIVNETNRLHPDKLIVAEDILAYGEKGLPYFNIRVYDFEILAALRRMKVVRYVEPTGFGLEDQNNRSSSGCGSNDPDYSLQNGVDYTVIAPNAKMSWNYTYSNIEAAWSQSTGDNITVGLIDTGVSQGQNKLNSQYSSGWSTGRTITRKGFLEDCWLWWCSNQGVYDDCGHGTSMAGTIAAPRTSAGSSVGVAYNANLVSCKGSEDVVVNTSDEKDGVSDSYYYLANRSDVKLISMSMGDVFWSNQVADAIYYANNKGKLMFCAAGTSLSWTSWWGVIFPATMSQTVAVTGIKTGSPMEKCVECHDGSQVDFVVVMQDRNNTNRGPITLADYSVQPNYTGGSSVATATVAGIAALVWEENPSLSKTQVLNYLKQNASYYPGRNGSFGWGIIDAAAAVNAVP